jgi:hypothetical protein
MKPAPEEGPSADLSPVWFNVIGFSACSLTAVPDSEVFDVLVVDLLVEGLVTCALLTR